MGRSARNQEKSEKYRPELGNCLPKIPSYEKEKMDLLEKALTFSATTSKINFSLYFTVEDTKVYKYLRNFPKVP